MCFRHALLLRNLDPNKTRQEQVDDFNNNKAFNQTVLEAEQLDDDSKQPPFTPAASVMTRSAVRTLARSPGLDLILSKSNAFVRQPAFAHTQLVTVVDIGGINMDRRKMIACNHHQRCTRPTKSVFFTVPPTLFVIY